MRLTPQEQDHLTRWLIHNWKETDEGIKRWKLIERYLNTIDEEDHASTLDRGWNQILANATDWAMEEVTR